MMFAVIIGYKLYESNWKQKQVKQDNNNSKKSCFALFI